MQCCIEYYVASHHCLAMISAAAVASSSALFSYYSCFFPLLTKPVRPFFLPLSNFETSYGEKVFAVLTTFFRRSHGVLGVGNFV